jgi:PAS domain S-box-containing protein
VPDIEDFEDLYENAPCGYLSLRPDGRVSKVNGTFLRWTGFAKGELDGRRFLELLTIAGRIYYETHFAPLLRMQGAFNEVALDLLSKDGKHVPTLINAVERRNADGEQIFVRMTVFNATDRRRYESELVAARSAAETASIELRELNATLEARIDEAVAERMKAEESLRQSQKMEAVGQLTGGVAHDFNNLLTVILGGLETIDRQLAKIPQSAEVARIHRARSMAQQGAERAATLTARLLAFSRRQALAPKVVDANKLIVGLSEMLHRTLGATIRLETVAAAGLWRAIVDPAELENAIVNLAINARDAMPGGGRLTIETSNAFLDEAYVAGIPETVATGQYVLIAVSDTGHGMDPATVARVFEPFFTTKDAGKGTGLGLSQVYGFVRQTSGHVRIYSEVGEGTSVKLYLPRAAEGAVEAETERVAETGWHGGHETVLVVEDHEALRNYSSGILRELGYTVLEADSGVAALTLLRANSDVALLFTDIVLPGGMDGRQLSREASIVRPDLKVLFTTGYTQNAIVHHGRLDKGIALLSKPFTFDALAAKVRSILDEAT